MIAHECLSVNQATIKYASLSDALTIVSKSGIPAVGLWREPVAEVGLDEAVRRVEGSGLRVSSLCRGGFLTGDTSGMRERAIEDNRHAIDEAAALGAPALVLVAGGLPSASRDLAGARERVRDAIGVLAPHAEAAGVTLAIEPLHPMYATDRAVISTLGQALDIAQQFDSTTVGVVVDTFHVFWDPQVFDQIARAGSHIASYQVCDWATPLPADVLLARRMMGEGVIDFAPITRAVLAAGYRGDIEVEIFNQELWDADPGEVVAATVRSFHETIAPALVNWTP
jgi:sugar phosphate isomerase/epimerase